MLITPIVIVILGVILGMGVVWRWYLMSDVVSNIPIVIISAMIGVFLWGYRERIEKASGKDVTPVKDTPETYHYNSTFDDLSIHYLQTKNLETPDSSQFKYLVDNSMGKAYF